MQFRHFMKKMTNNVSFLSLSVLDFKVNFDDALIVLKLSEVGHIKNIFYFLKIFTVRRRIECTNRFMAYHI